MSPDEYTWAAARTATKSFYPDKINSASLAVDVLHAVHALERLDYYKKALFYNVPMPGGFHTEEAHNFPHVAEPADANFIHGTLGIATEAGELLAALKDWRWPTVSDGGTPPVNRRLRVKEELGDLMWYMAMLCRWAGISFEEVMTSNLAKLAVRYPKGFTEENAITRDHAAEQLALDFGSSPK